MNVAPRPYQPQDLGCVLEFVGQCAALTDFCGGMHPGDICHIMSEHLRGRHLDQHFHLYETDGTMAALVQFYPFLCPSYDLLIDPARREAGLEQRLLSWSERTLSALARQAGSPESQIETDVADCDLARRDALLGLGYTAPAAPYVVFRWRSLQTPIPKPLLPGGFTIRSVAGEHEAALLSAAHGGAFGSDWPPGDYLRLMRTPGFDLDRELIVVAPDGRCAALLVYWIDPSSRSGLFEPVGCHPDFQRRGLTRALMLEGLRRMAARGLATAIVKHTAKNEAAAALYRSVGFAPKYGIFDFRKTLQ